MDCKLLGTWELGMMARNRIVLGAHGMDGLESNSCYSLVSSVT